MKLTREDLEFDIEYLALGALAILFALLFFV